MRVPFCSQTFKFCAVLGLLAALFLFSPRASESAIYRVDKANAGGGNGSSWATALNEVQFIDTLKNLAVAGDEFWVAKGSYRPTLNLDQKIAFALKNGVELYGGFAGTETAREERNWKTNETILTGDIDNDGTKAGNSYHIVTAANVSSFAVLDGFTITGGNAVSPNDSIDTVGGGMLNLASQPVVRNCTFRENFANLAGGAMVNVGAIPIVTDCLFSKNSALTSGSAMYNDSGSDARITGCVFSENTVPAGNGAGAILNDESSPVIKNCLFVRNTAFNGRGAAIGNSKSSPRILGCTFSENKGTQGGAIANASASSPILINCTFWSNEATFGGALWNQGSTPEVTNCTFSKNSAAVDGAGMYNNNSSPVVVNSVFWNGSGGEIINENGSTPAVSFSVVQGGYAGTSNLSSDPLLEDPADNGGQTPTSALPSGSPAVDSGTDTGAPTEDQRGISRPQGAGMDMGAYELEQTAPPPPTPSGSGGGCSSLGLVGGIWLLLPLLLLGRRDGR